MEFLRLIGIVKLDGDIGVVWGVHRAALVQMLQIELDTINNNEPVRSVFNGLGDHSEISEEVVSCRFEEFEVLS